MPFVLKRNTSILLYLRGHFNYCPAPRRGNLLIAQRQAKRRLGYMNVNQQCTLKGQKHYGHGVIHG